MQLRCFLLTIFLSCVTLPVIAADPAHKKKPEASSRASHVIKIGAEHPLYFQLRKHVASDELTRYRQRVQKFLNDNKKNGTLSKAVSEALQYGNFIENRNLKAALIEETHKSLQPLIGIEVANVIKENETDIPDAAWWMFFSKSSLLKDVTHEIVFRFKNLIDKSSVHKSYTSIKSVARLSCFLTTTRTDEDNPENYYPVFMNDNSASFADAIEKWAENASSSSSSSSAPSFANHTLENIMDYTLKIFLKKEKDIERGIYFAKGFDTEIRRLHSLIGPQSSTTATEDNGAISTTHNASSSSSTSRIPDGFSREKRSLYWGKNYWMLNNYVDANFAKLNTGIDPFYQHTDGYYYVDLGLNSVMKGARVVMQLQELRAGHRFAFKDWTTLTAQCILSELNGKLPSPEWKAPAILDVFNVTYNTENLYARSKFRFPEALPYKSPAQHKEWLERELKAQVLKFQSNTSHAEVGWYGSRGIFTYHLPLIDNKKLVFVAVLELDQEKNNFNVVTLLLPAWAYNNCIVLVAPKTSWLKDYASTYSDEEEESQKNQQLTIKNASDRQRSGWGGPQPSNSSKGSSS